MYCVKRGTLGGSEHRNTAEKFAIPHKKSPNTVSKLDVILKPLHCTLTLEQIARKQKLRFGNVRFRQNKSHSSSVLANNN